MYHAIVNEKKSILIVSKNRKIIDEYYDDLNQNDPDVSGVELYQYGVVSGLSAIKTSAPSYSANDIREMAV